MTKERICANRRELILGGTAAALVPMRGVAAPVSEIQRLYAKWLAQKEAYTIAGKGSSKAFIAAKAAGLNPHKAETEYEAEFVDPLWDAMDKTELLIEAEPADTLIGLAIKIAVAFWIEGSFDTAAIASLQSDAVRALAVTQHMAKAV